MTAPHAQSESHRTVLRRDVPLVPVDSVAGRSLVVVVGIMVFLACLAAGGALLVADASESWRSDVLHEVTIQIKPRPGDDIEGLVTKAVTVASRATGVGKVRPYSEADSARLLAPWLGKGLDLSLLPVPRIIVVQMDARANDTLAALRSNLTQEVPQANLDDQRAWADRISAVAHWVVALATSLFVLAIVALGTAIGFATRGAMAGNREIIEVLHLVGASEAFIAREFERHFRRLGLQGALAGVICAATFFLVCSAASYWSKNVPGGEEVASMFGFFTLPLSGYAVLGGVGVAVIFLTGWLSRVTAMRQLRSLH